jgi:gas vesicle protein
MDSYAMENDYKTTNPASFFLGLVLGSLAGGLTALLLVPQSGKKTRQQIQHKVIELRDQTTAKVENAVAQVRTKADEVYASVSDQAKELKQQGQDVLVEQLDRVSAAAENGKQAIQGKHI